MKRSRRERARAWGMRGLAASFGLVAWIMLLTGQYGSDRGWIAFLVVITVASVAVGLIAGVDGASFGLWVLSAPAAVAPFTAPRGNGLWALIYVPLLIAAGWASMLAEGASRLRRRDPRLPAPAATAIGAAATVVAAIVLAVVSWPDPWPALEEDVRRVPVPEGFTVASEFRTGSAVGTGRPPTVIRVLRARLREAQACRVMMQAMRTLPAVEVHRDGCFAERSGRRVLFVTVQPATRDDEISAIVRASYT